MTRAAKVRKKKRRRRPNPRNSGDGAGNHHSRMHRSESARQTGFALHVFSEQEKSAHAEPAREKEIQSVFAKAHASSRNQVTVDATQDRQTPFRFSPRQSRHAPTQDRHLDRSDRLQKPRSPEKFVTESGKILPRRVTGMPAHLHRKITREIKRSRSV